MMEKGNVYNPLPHSILTFILSTMWNILKEMIELNLASEISLENQFFQLKINLLDWVFEKIRGCNKKKKKND